MKIFVKGYYGYKNFGDELIVLMLIRRICQNFLSSGIFISCGDEKWLESWVVKQKKYLSQEELDRLVFLPKDSGIMHLKNVFGAGEMWDFIVFGGGQVVDENRRFPHDGRNLPILYRRYINGGNFALIGGLGTQNKDGTALLHKMLLERAKIVMLRDNFSMGIAEKVLEKKDKKKLSFIGDLSLPMLRDCADKIKETSEKNTRGKYVLINISPEVNFDYAFKKIKTFLGRFPDAQPVFFPAHFVDDMSFGKELQQKIPSLEIFDWTNASLEQTLKLFYFAQAGIGQRLHFLLILKYWGVEYEVLQNTHKLQVNLMEID